MKQFSGKNVIVTGASRGIGEATVRAFVATGANVVLLAQSAGRIHELAAELGDQALAIPCDISDFDAYQAAVEKTCDTFGAVDILIGNAGMIEPISLLSKTDPNAWRRAIDVNLTGVFNGMRTVLPRMQAQGHGTIITVSSGAAHNALEGWSAYCASKAGAAMLTASAHLENHSFGIRVMGLSPGTVATKMQRDIKASGIGPVAKLEWEDHIPPEWPAQTLLWMCSDNADPYVGQEIALRDEAIRKSVGLL